MEQNKFREATKTRTLERWYRKRLKDVAKQIGLIASEWDGKEESGLQMALFDYSVRLDEWAHAVSGIMIRRAAAADYETWLTIGKKISRATRKKLKDAAVGPIYSRLQQEQVTLIRSLPLEASKKVHDWTMKGLQDGERFADIVQRIKSDLGSVTTSRAVCIARTETARARTNFTQARAQAVGSTHYIWKTVGDGAVRPMHRALNNTVQSWSEPPICDIGKGGEPIRSHPGCVFNCRCFPTPIFIEKDDEEKI